MKRPKMTTPQLVVPVKWHPPYHKKQQQQHIKLIFKPCDSLLPINFRNVCVTAPLWPDTKTGAVMISGVFLNMNIDINVNLNHNMDSQTVGHWRPDLLTISYHPSQFWYAHLGTLPLFNVWVNLDKHWTITQREFLNWLCSCLSTFSKE